MKLTQNKNPQKTKRMLLGALIITVFAVAGGGFWYFYNHIQTVDATNKSTASFVFDQAKAAGWWTSGNTNPRDGLTKDYIGDPDELPVASIVTHQGKRDASSDCFVSYSYFGRGVDPTVALKEMEARTVKDNRLSLKKLGVRVVTIDVAGDTKSYELHQYNLVGSYDGDLKRGVEFGFLPLEDGYVDVRGYCSAANRLADTIPVIGAVRFNY